MTAIKVTGFKGIAPRVSPELLQDQAAQTANNCKLYSGDLIPFPEPIVAGHTGSTGDVRTIYPLRNPTTDELVWLSWDTEVNVARPAFQSDADEQRFYYSGDGAPKVSTYALATSGLAPYPNDYYDLGLPLPKEKLVATASTFTPATTASYKRDAGGLTTIVTAAPHNLRTGNFVSVSDFSYLTASYSRSSTTITVTLNNHGIAVGSTVYLTRTSGGMTDGAYVVSSVTTNTFDVTDPESGSTSGNLKLDIRSFNTTSSEIIVIDDTTFTYFAPGFEVATYAFTDGKVDLSGTPILRAYTFTWFTPWGEESIGSDPSEFLTVREGITATITGLPTTPPTIPSKNFIRGLRLYRTLASDRDADFFLLKTLWFPAATATVQRSGNVSTVKMLDPHNFIEDDRFKLTGCTDSTFDIVDGTVLDIVDQYTFTYNQAGTDVAETVDTTGVLYHDAAEKAEDDARYWGDGSYDFTDDFDARYLTDILTSDDYEPPPEDLVGFKTIQNNILCGFVNNKLRFSAPDHPHAWPPQFEKTLDFNIVAVEPISAVGAVVLTDGYPYLITGSDPDIMSVQRIDALYPCRSSRGVVSMSYGILYPTNEGLAVYSPTSGPRILTEAQFEQDTWNTYLDPTTIVGAYYGDAYFGSHSGGSFVFQFEAQTGGVFVTCDTQFDAAYNDPHNNRFYFTLDGTGNIFEWDDLTQPRQTVTWKSKVIKLQDYQNFGAARVVADYEGLSANWEDIDTNWEDLDMYWNASSGITFRLYADKQLVFETVRSNSAIFRLPTGFRSDTYEFEIEGDVRVRAVHIGQTPLSLKEV